ncbi:hypothetical protein AVEN_93599-1, partial [Araneus ventricosus]
MDCPGIVSRSWSQSSHGVAHTEEMANVRALLFMDRLWTVRELSLEVGLSHQTVWYVLKKWRMLGRSVAVINKQHLADGILWMIILKECNAILL